MKFILLIFISMFINAQYYKSNIMGEKISQVNSLNDATFIVYSSSKPSKNVVIENNMLYYKKEYIRKWIRYYDDINGIVLQEKEYIGAFLKFDRTFDEQNRIITENEYSRKVVNEVEKEYLKQSVIYNYTNGLLTKKTYKNSDNTIYTDLYYYTYNGSIRNIIRSQNDGLGYHRYRYYNDGIMKSELEKDGNNLKNVTYDSLGRVLNLTINTNRKIKNPEYIELIGGKDKKNVVQENNPEYINKTDNIKYSYLYSGEEKLPLSETIVSSDGTSVEKKFYPNGLVKDVSTYFRDKIQDSTNYIYDASARVIKETSKNGSINTVYDYTYEDGQLISTLKTVNGAIEKKTEYFAKDEWVESIYSKGVMVLKVYYRDNKISSQEEIKNGKVISKIDYDY